MTIIVWDCGWDSADWGHVPMSISNDHAECQDHIRAGSDCQLFQSLRQPCAVFRCCRGPSRSAGHTLRCRTQSVATLPSAAPCRFVSAAPNYWRGRSWLSVRSADSWRCGGWEFERKTGKWAEPEWLGVHAASWRANRLGFDSRQCRRTRLRVSQACAAVQLTAKLPDLFLSCEGPYWLWGPRSLLFIGYWGSKTAGVAKLAKVKNAWSSTSSPSLVLLVLKKR